MIKRFAITLITLSTLLYGSIFVSSLLHDTRFFDEIVIQLNRMSTNLNNMDEVQHSKLILNTILENETPPENWQTLITKPPKDDFDQLFYFYKVWTIKTGLTQKNIKKSYPIYKAHQNQLTIINMRYGKKKPILQFPFSKTSQGNLVSGLFFAINEMPFSADYNGDERIDHKDVLLALKK
jgi:hypothetical protein